MTTEIIAELPRGVGRRVPARGRCDRPVERTQIPRRRHHRRPHRGRARPLHSAYRVHRGGDRPEHRRRDRAVHLQRRADVLPLPRARRTAGRPRDHGRHVRPRHRAGHRRHRDKGRDPQVRDRRTGRHRRVWSGCCAPSHRHTAAPECRSRRIRTRAPGVGSSSSASSPRKASTCPAWSSATRGDTTDLDVSGGTRRQRLLHRDGPVRRRRVPPVRGPRRHRGRACASAATPTRWCSPTTPPAIIDCTAGGDDFRSSCRIGTTCTSTTTSSRR